ncbi:MAG: threonine aldolase [Planctomycetota bacterium]
MTPIDLRSDTVTRPDAAMRRAMAEAEVGDDVFGDDPTVIRLQERAAELVGKPAALFVPSGCMANLIGVMAQAPAGSEILVGARSHINSAESAAYARLAQVNKCALPEDERGRLDPVLVRSSIRFGAEISGGNSHHATTTLLALENTHNYCGGSALSVADMRAPIAAARERAPWIKVHLDGARIFNAAAVLNVSARDIAALADSVSFCLSKSLGAPAGSLICGSNELVARGVGLRKMLGGGMRQAGILAAAGLEALKTPNLERLADDHANARRLAEGLAELPGIVADPASVQTNILFIEYRGRKGDTAWLGRALTERGVWCLALGERLRMVTHRDVTRAQIDAALKLAAGILKD